MLLVWIEFLIVAALVVCSGSRLAYHSEVIAEKTGMSRTWVGVMLVTTMTSLPELLTGASAVDAIYVLNAYGVFVLET